MKTAEQSNLSKSAWRETTIGSEFYPVSDSFDFNGKTQVHFLNTGDILDGKLLHNDSSTVSTLPGQAKKSFKKGDILYSEIRPENKRFMLVDFDASNSVASTKLMVLRTKDTIDKKFAYQVITAPETVREFHARAEARSGTFPQITFEAISDFRFLLPPLPEQKEIAAVLSSLDDKIELLRAQNKTLEGMAQALFNQWFVKFDFPDANGRPYRSSGGKMVDSELGEIPAGWRVGKLNEIADIDWGNTDITKSSYVPNGKYLAVSAAGGDGRINHKEYDYGALVVSAIGEYCGRLFMPTEDFTAIKNTLVVKSKTTKTSYFEYLGLQNWELQKRGAAQPFISKGDTEGLQITIPHAEAYNDFATLVSPIFEKIKNNVLAANTLTLSRNALLPKLMKGKILV